MFYIINISDITIYEENNLSKEIFNQYNIPEEYQKIVIKNTIFSLKDHGDGHELITGTLIDLTGGQIINKNKKKFTLITYLSKNKDIHIKINIPECIASNEEVSQFYKNLEANNLKNNYELAINKLINYKEKHLTKELKI